MCRVYTYHVLVLTACQATRCFLILHKLHLFLRTENII